MRITKTITLDEVDIRMAIAAWFPDAVLPDDVKLECKEGVITTRGIHTMQAVIETISEQDTPPAPEQKKPVYPKRSEVDASPAWSAKTAQPFWTIRDGVIFDSDGNFVCKEEELQDG